MEMATLSSKATSIPPLLPWPADFAENHNNELKLTPWSLQKGVMDQLPIRFVSPLPRKSPVRSKHGIARRNNGRRKGESFETIVGSCLSRAVAFSNRRFRAILKSFSDSSARKNTSVRDVRCKNAGETYSNDGPINNNGNGDKGGGGGGGREISFPSGGKSGGGTGGNYSAMGANWWRWKCQTCASRGGSGLISVANQGQLYQHATTREWVVQWVLHVAITRALTEPVLVDLLQQAITLPLQFVALLLMGPEFGESVVQFLTAVLGAGSIATVVLLWLLWRWWWSRGQGLGDLDDKGDKGEDEDAT